MITERPVSSSDHVHSSTFESGFSQSMTISNISSKATKPKRISDGAFQGEGKENMIHSNHLGHMIIMATMPI